MRPAVIDLVWEMGGIHCVNIWDMAFYRDIVVNLLLMDLASV